MEATTAQLAAHLDVEYAIASALIKLIVKSGKGRELRKVPQPSGKGKPSTVYQLPESFTIELVAK